ncbi:MAG TPA: hypothetical protein VFC78_04685 [Tepidisphaeraceae bacterium]|nr:hypothetical protein [Tepidisphaeraceae bacterium]
MSSTFRRFEVLLPLRFNDGCPIPAELVSETLLEIESQFGAVSCEPHAVEGQWRHRGQTIRDDLTRVFVDVPDTPQSFEFFRELKERLKSRFQQIDVWMTSFPIDLI